jgi:hypothetical protein
LSNRWAVLVEKFLAVTNLMNREYVTGGQVISAPAVPE